MWAQFGAGIETRTMEPIFWEQLGEHLDCFRVCDECGRPMIEGYVVDGGAVYCSEICLNKHISEYDFTDNGDTYYTVWYEDSITYKEMINR